VNSATDKKPAFSVLLGGRNDDAIMESVQFILEVEFKSSFELAFYRFRNEAELRRMMLEGPFHFICMYVLNVKWQADPGDDSFRRAAGVLGGLANRHPETRILALSAWEPARDFFDGTGVIFLPCPFQVRDVQRILRGSLPDRNSEA